jgi:flagellar M-ring protein FliF
MGQNAKPEDINAKITEIEELVSSAAGFSKTRGDQIKVAAVSFIEESQSLEPLPGPSFSEIFMRQFGNIVNALTILALSVMLIWFGLRPAVKMLVARQQAELEYQREQAAALAASEAAAALAAQAEIEKPAQLRHSEPDMPNLLENANTPQRKLEHIVDLNEEQAAAVLRQWLMQDAA